MSLVPLERVTLAGMTDDKSQLLDDLQIRGCLELIPFSPNEKLLASPNLSSQSREALKFLLACPQRRRQLSEHPQFDAESVERASLDLLQRIQSLEEERDDLLLHLEETRPFGDFQRPELQDLAGEQLWFYAVPNLKMTHVEASALVWNVVSRDARFCYVVVVSRTEPESMPVPWIPLDSRSMSEMSRRLEEVETAIEDAQAERASLTRWCLLLSRAQDRLEDAASRTQAEGQTLDLEPIFAIQAWAPREHISELAAYAVQQGFLFESHPPEPDDTPPTLMRNAPRVSAGEDLVNFYMTPGYGTWDPSGVVMVSFALFFAMILADAGYAAVLGLGLLLIWRKLNRSTTGKKFRPLLALIVVASLIYGVIVGSYFGIAPAPESLPGRLQLLDMNNSQLMMGISVLVGGIHVVLANVMDACRHKNWRNGLASFGWSGVVAGGLLFAAGKASSAVGWLEIPGLVGVVTGLLLVVGYTAPHEKPARRFLYGLLGLTKLSAAFGDVLSYLRLFALGLASASLAVAFNDMAAGIRSGLPQLGLLFSLLVLLFGHSLNLLLGVSSGVIHGLRLNVIEFFNWGLKDEGRRFEPFRRQEGSLWK